MRRVFADTFFWIVLTNPADRFHEEAHSVDLAGPVAARIEGERRRDAIPAGAALPNSPLFRGTFFGALCYKDSVSALLPPLRVFPALVLCGLMAASLAPAQRPGPGNPQAQLNKRFQSSGLEVGKPFPAVDIHDASGKPLNTSSLKGFTTVVVSGCLT